MSYLEGALRTRRILVTGISGFIGGHLGRRLAQEEGATVTGCGRNLEKVSFLKDVGVDLRQADLLDAETMGLLLTGQEIVFHLAWLGRETGAVGDAHTQNVKVTKRLVQAAADAGVQRFVFTSSINAYGPSINGAVGETHPVDEEQRDAYGRAKATTEKALQAVTANMNLELVIVRPAMVYGPGSFVWTVRLLEMVQRGVPVIFGHGRGFAYPLFIDNLVDGLSLASVRAEAAGETYNFCDPPVDWQTFFDFYGAMCGRQPRALPMWAARILALASETFRLHLPLTRERLQLYARKISFPTTKAESELGYRPRVTLAEGMKRTETWLSDEGLLSH